MVTVSRVPGVKTRTSLWDHHSKNLQPALQVFEATLVSVLSGIIMCLWVTRSECGSGRCCLARPACVIVRKTFDPKTPEFPESVSFVCQKEPFGVTPDFMLSTASVWGCLQKTKQARAGPFRPTHDLWGGEGAGGDAQCKRLENRIWGAPWLASPGGQARRVRHRSSGGMEASALRTPRTAPCGPPHPPSVHVLTINT